MTRKDYVKIAQVFADQINTEHSQKNSAGVLTLARSVRSMADMLQSDNPRFDRARFTAACGITPGASAVAEVVEVHGGIPGARPWNVDGPGPSATGKPAERIAPAPRARQA